MKACPNTEGFLMENLGDVIDCKDGCQQPCVVGIDRWVNGEAVMRLDPINEN